MLGNFFYRLPILAALFVSAAFGVSTVCSAQEKVLEAVSLPKADPAIVPVPRDAVPRDTNWWMQRYESFNKCVKEGNVDLLMIGTNNANSDSVFLTEDRVLTREIMPDLLHPKQKGYAIWAEAMEPTIAKLMGSQIVTPAAAAADETNLVSNPSFERAAAPLAIGSRLEPLVDDFLISEMIGDVHQQLHQPTPREVVLVAGEPWEGNISNYFTVFQDDDRYRMC